MNRHWKRRRSKKKPNCWLKFKSEVGLVSHNLGLVTQKHFCLSGIRLQRRKGADSDLSLDDLEPTHPAASRKAVHLDGNHLVWPVLFLYPEFGETDFIEAFEENHTFSDHLAMMFGSEAAPAPWDGEGKYRLQDLELCYETDDGSKLVRIRPEQTLNDVISDKRYLVKGGTPGFLIMVKGSKFHKDFTSKYDS